MEIDIQDIRNNYANLTDDEKEIIRKLMNGPARAVIGKVFGPEFDAALGQFMLPIAERGKGLAARQ
jgi:hypothetical protein